MSWPPPYGPPYGPPTAGGPPYGPPPYGPPKSEWGPPKSEWGPSPPSSGWQAPPWSWTQPSHCYGTFEWIRDSHGSHPPGAVHGGVDADGGPIYVGRAWHHGDLLPAKVCPRHRCAFVSFRGRQHEERHYEVLVSNHVAWRPGRGGAIPPEAIRVGHTGDGEPLYAGRTMHQGTLTVGKVHPSHGCLYIAWSGIEMKFYDYEIMCLD